MDPASTTPALTTPTLTRTEFVDTEKVDLIADQANRLYDFALESREILSKEAGTTIQWLFGIIVGGSGYIVTLFKPQTPAVPIPWAFIITLGTVVLVAAAFAFRLFNGALVTKGVKPPGNLPSHLANDEQIEYEANMIRLREIMELEEPINEAIQHNHKVGQLINETRYVIAVLPILAVVVLVFSRLYLTLGG